MYIILMLQLKCFERKMSTSISRQMLSAVYQLIESIFIFIECYEYLIHYLTYDDY